MLVTNRSPHSTNSTTDPSSGLTEVIPPEPSVPTQTLPSPSTASESRYWNPGSRVSSSPPCGRRPSGTVTSPGPAISHCHTQALYVSATYSRLPSGERPTPLGESSGGTTSLMTDPSGCA